MNHTVQCLAQRVPARKRQSSLARASHAALIALRGLVIRWLGGAETYTSLDWRRIIGRLAHRTLSLFLVVASAALTVALFPVPAGLAAVVWLAFTVISVIQAAIWIREAALIALERQAARRPADAADQPVHGGDAHAAREHSAAQRDQRA